MPASKRGRVPCTHCEPWCPETSGYGRQRMDLNCLSIPIWPRRWVDPFGLCVTLRMGH
jgi:hypothetical protein